MHIVRDSPLRDLGVVLSQCAHVVVPDEEDSSKLIPRRNWTYQVMTVEIVRKQMTIMYQRVGRMGRGYGYYSEGGG